MKVRFWGTRGSLPATQNEQTVRTKVKHALEVAVEKGIDPETDIDSFMERELDFWVRGTFGTNTPCVEIMCEGDEFVLCDAGTGLRDFGKYVVTSHDYSSGKNFHIFLSHPHWDHIQGFPFFAPAYMKGNHIIIYGGHEELEKVFATQQQAPFFPIDFTALGAEIDFVVLDVGRTYEIAGMDVVVAEQNHPGISYGYRFEKDGKVVVYSTDSENKKVDMLTSNLVDFFRNADLLIYDAQYVFFESITHRANWGHSSNVVAVELAKSAKAGHLCLFHTEPSLNDENLEKFLEDTREYSNIIEEGPLRISMAYEGLVIEV